MKKKKKWSGHTRLCLKYTVDDMHTKLLKFKYSEEKNDNVII